LQCRTVQSYNGQIGAEQRCADADASSDTSFSQRPRMDMDGSRLKIRGRGLTRIINSSSSLG